MNAKFKRLKILAPHWLTEHSVESKHQQRGRKVKRGNGEEEVDKRLVEVTKGPVIRRF